MLICTRTGCDVFVEEYDCYVHGDLYEDFEKGYAVVRGVQEKYSCDMTTLKDVDVNVHDIAHWFNRGDRNVTSTLIFSDYTRTAQLLRYMKES